MITLSIISIFIVGISSFIGIQIPNYINPNYLNNLKIFSCGIIISTGFIHMISEGQSDLNELDIEYPLGNLITGLTILCIIGLEDLFIYLIKLNYNIIKPPRKNNDPIHKPTIYKPLEHYHESVIEKELCDINICNNEESNSNLVIDISEVQIKSYIIMHLLEIGIVIHSVIIGISLGLLDDVLLQSILLVVISIHQLFEGVSISNGLLQLYKLPRYHYIFMIVVFILTTPIGICIGIILSESYSHNLLINGVLNCISGGLLIYTGIHNLININNKNIIMYSLLFLGFTCMSILGIWS